MRLSAQMQFSVRALQPTVVRLWEKVYLTPLFHFLILVVMQPKIAGLIKALENAAKTDSGLTDELNTILADPVPKVTGMVLDLSVVFVVVLMVFRPF
jgi:hypothetical protein